MPKPILGGVLGGIADDTIEKLKEQAQDTVQGLADAVTGDQAASGDVAEDSGDSGIELQSGKTDPAKVAQQAQQQGLTPQQLMAKRQEEKVLLQFHQQQIQEWAATHSHMSQEKQAKEKREIEEGEAKKQQEMQQLQIEEAKSAVLSPPKKAGKPSRGSAFVVQQSQKANMAEMSKMPSN